MFSSAGNRSAREYAREVLATVAFAFIYISLVLCLFRVLGFIGSDTGSNVNFPLFSSISVNWFLSSNHLTVMQALATPIVAFKFLGTVIFAPVIEEVLFRGIVCNFASDEFGRLKPRSEMIIFGGAFIVFGLLHGNWYLSIMIQGVFGLLLARLWFRNGPKQRASYISCVVAHSLYNLLVVANIWLYGNSGT